MPEYDIIVCQACKLSQIWSHMLQNDPIKIKTNNYKIYDRLPNKVVFPSPEVMIFYPRSNDNLMISQPRSNDIPAQQ